MITIDKKDADLILTTNDWRLKQIDYRLKILEQRRKALITLNTRIAKAVKDNE